MNLRLPKNRRSLSTALLLTVTIVAGARPSSQQPRPVQFPNPDVGAETLAARKQEQLAAAREFDVFYQFQLTDRVKESGITYVHRVVNDGGKTFKAMHYDHGNGLAVADVDGDGLYDIYFVSQLGGNELWKNMGGGRFTNITHDAGVAVAGRIPVTASFADIDNDGDQDLFVTTVRGGNVLFENDGRGHFADISQQAGVGLVAHSSGSVFLDYDHDGLLDLFVTNVGKYTSDVKGPDGAYAGLADAFQGFFFPERFERPVLYRNLGQNHFADVTSQMDVLPRGWAGDAGVVDLNGDSWPDLFVLNMAGRQHYYENAAGKRFVDKTAQYFARGPMGAMGIAQLDFDNDGRADVFITDMHADMHMAMGPRQEKIKIPGPTTGELTGMGPAASFIYGNVFYRNRPDGTFPEASDQLGVETYWPWGTTAGDLNADGWTDLFVTGSMSFPFRYAINSMLLNNLGQKFLDAEFLLGIEPRRDGRISTPWFVENCADPNRANRDGLPLGLGDPCGGENGTIQVMGTLGSRSSAMFDLDNDGDLDIVATNQNAEPQVLISDLSARKKIQWLSVVLVGTTSNRSGLGATVRVVAGKQSYTKYHDGKSGYLSASALPLYFGLGDATAIDRVEVTWPAGRTQVQTSGIQMNGTLRITEPR